MDEYEAPGRGKTDILGGERAPVALGRPQIAHGLAWPRTGVSALSGRRLIA